MPKFPRFRSTREDDGLVPFSSALLQGLAPDGGLYVPERIPPVMPVVRDHADGFQNLAIHVLDRWLDDAIPTSERTSRIASALNFEVPLVPLEDPTGRYEGIHILELFHGPTLSFKDFGARTMAQLMEVVLAQRNERLTILVATSGDTGSAVADGFAGQNNIEVILLYPDGQVSPIQEQQLVVERPGVRVLAVEGVFDDCQRMVKAAFGDPELDHITLSSANSINVGRLLPQMLYYFWGAAQLDFPDEVIFTVPSGNLGNLTGGVMAHLGGLPVSKFVAAHNVNDFFPAYLEGDRTTFKDSVQTLSNAMDVGAPSNFERIKWLLGNEGMRSLIWGTSVTDETTRQRMRDVYDRTGYIACPHTSVGIEAAVRYREDHGTEVPMIVLSTAHPAKFPETVESTLDIENVRAEALERLKERPTSRQLIKPSLDDLRDFLLTQSMQVASR